jgi:hypothetical protein
MFLKTDGAEATCGMKNDMRKSQKVGSSVSFQLF